MSISRQLKTTLLFSLSWHLFWISFVSIVFLPPKFQKRQHARVNFVGSILKKPIAIAQLPAAKTKHLAQLPAEAYIHNQSRFNEDLSAPLTAEREPFNPDNLIDVDSAQEAAFSADSFVVEDTVDAQRELIFKPPLLKYPEWMEQGSRGSRVIFKIYICTDGLVEQSICLQASGSPEMDAALARYISRWRFAPVAAAEGQWQTVTIDLGLDE